VCEEYEKLRALVLAGAQRAPGLAVVRLQGLWAWLRLTPPEPDARKSMQLQAKSHPAPSVQPACQPMHAREVATIWAQMLLARPLAASSAPAL